MWYYAAGWSTLKITVEKSLSWIFSNDWSGMDSFVGR